MHKYILVRGEAGGKNPGEKEAGRLREMGKERAGTPGSGIPKVEGTKRNRKKLQHCITRKSTEARGSKEGAGTGRKMYGKQEVPKPPPPPPPLNIHVHTHFSTFL